MYIKFIFKRDTEFVFFPPSNHSLLILEMIFLKTSNFFNESKFLYVKTPPPRKKCKNIIYQLKNHVLESS